MDIPPPSRPQWRAAQSTSCPSNNFKAAAATGMIVGASTGTGGVCVGLWSNSIADGGRWGRNPNLIIMIRRCVPSRFSYSSWWSSPSPSPSPNGSISTRSLAKFDWYNPGAYKDGGDLPDESDSHSYDDGDFEIEIEETGNNRRRIQSRVSVEASLQTVWNILTDYEKLADFIPGLAVSQLLQKTDNFARLFQVTSSFRKMETRIFVLSSIHYKLQLLRLVVLSRSLGNISLISIFSAILEQIGQQNLAFGLKFKAKGVIDCYEKDLQNFPFGQRRDIEFQMIEGDFQLFQGKWSVKQINARGYELTDSILGQEFHTTLSYVVDVEPKVWLPVRLVQGRLCKEIKMNLLCIKKAAEEAVQNKVSVY